MKQALTKIQWNQLGWNFITNEKCIIKHMVHLVLAQSIPSGRVTSSACGCCVCCTRTQSGAKYSVGFSNVWMAQWRVLGTLTRDSEDKVLQALSVCVSRRGQKLNLDASFKFNDANKQRGILFTEHVVTLNWNTQYTSRAYGQCSCLSHVRYIKLSKLSKWRQWQSSRMTIMCLLGYYRFDFPLICTVGFDRAPWC